MAEFTGRLKGGENVFDSMEMHAIDGVIQRDKECCATCRHFKQDYDSGNYCDIRLVDCKGRYDSPVMNYEYAPVHPLMYCPDYDRAPHNDYGPEWWDIVAMESNS